MKPSTIALGLSALALAMPGVAEAKRLRQGAATLVEAAPAHMAPEHLSPDAFAQLDLDALPPPGANAMPAGTMTASLPAAPVVLAQLTPSGGMSHQLSMPRANRIAHANAVPVTDYSRPQRDEVPAADPRPARDSSPRFDLVANNAPASQVFLQMSAGSGTNVMVPPEVKGNITVNLKAVTLAEAMEAMRELYGYDFKVSGNRIFVYPNTIQTRIYQVNYLAARRDGSSVLKVNNPGRPSTSGTPGVTGAVGATGTNMGANTSAGTTVSGSGGGAIATGGGGAAGFSEATRVQMSISTDFWRDMANSLKDIVGDEKEHSVSINPGSGVLVVRASPNIHRQVNEYLKAMRMTIERQVMLEAKIVEVTLSNETQAGVNWSLFRTASNGGKVYGANVMAPGVTLTTPGVNINGTNVNAVANTGALTSPDVTVNAGGVINTLKTGAGFYGLALQAGNSYALLNFLQSQGDVQVLSSPRIATINNQKAVLKVGQDAYFPINLPTPTFTTTTAGTQINVTPPQVDTIFSGIVLDVTPRIDSNGSILLHVHPIISTITTETLTYTYNNIVGTGDLPKISVNETDSIVRVQDRQIVAIGGLMSQSTTKAKSGVLGLSELPLIGGLFRQKSDTVTKRELVVLIKPTIIGDEGEGFERDNSPDTLAQ